MKDPVTKDKAAVFAISVIWFKKTKIVRLIAKNITTLQKFTMEVHQAKFLRQHTEHHTDPNTKVQAGKKATHRPEHEGRHDPKKPKMAKGNTWPIKIGVKPGKSGNLTTESPDLKKKLETGEKEPDSDDLG